MSAATKKKKEKGKKKTPSPCHHRLPCCMLCGGSSVPPFFVARGACITPASFVHLLHASFVRFHSPFILFMHSICVSISPRPLGSQEPHPAYLLPIVHLPSSPSFIYLYSNTPPTPNPIPPSNPPSCAPPTICPACCPWCCCP